jgi:cation:H+ antiporter
LLIAIPALVLALVIILAAAELFTNSVEWLGKLLGLHEGAVGSILAAIGTALPETLIPIIAILFTAEGATSDEIGIGAILGAPFMLSTAAFSVTGLAVLYFSRRGRRTTEMRVDGSLLRRDVGFFLGVYVAAIAASFLPQAGGLKHWLALLLLGAYASYVWRTLTREHDISEEDPAPLYASRLLRHDQRPRLPLTVLQFVVSLAMIIGGARLFVSQISTVSDRLGAPALVLSLVIAPLATELPEKFNSVLWVRNSKDTLALGNISGAMVFQSCIPVAVGVAFTDWRLTQPALIAALIALASAGIVFASLRGRALSARVLAYAGLFYLAFLAYVIVVRPSA